jgi:transcriptional regulator GlxA family with amidase domain
LETAFAAKRQVKHYADNLGMPTKAVINARLALEAKRLLAHTTLPVQTISSDLGFDEATSFDKFFRKEVGTTPQRRHSVNSRTHRGRL